MVTRTKTNTNASGAKRRSPEGEEPTSLMLKVAAKAPNSKAVKKILPPEVIEELAVRRARGEELSKDEQIELRKDYSERKRWLFNHEIDNLDHLYLLPNIVSDGSWLKVFNFSALYYAYRLADRMGRQARVVADTDRTGKSEYAASIAGGIENFKAEMIRLEAATYEGMQNGVHVFKLKHPVSIDEYGQLRKHEAVLRERAHNALRPKNANPKLYSDILLSLRQVTPKVVKLSKVLYHVFGDELARSLAELMAVYQNYCGGYYVDKIVAGKEMLRLCNKIIAITISLVECRAWTTEVAASVGENINQIKQTVIKDFGLK